MLESHKYDEYVFNHKLSRDAIDYISSVRNSDAPSRTVGTHAKGNVSLWVFSNKMGRTISLESSTGENPFAISNEYDIPTIEYWDQPEPVSISITTKKGKKRNSSYTPDFLVLKDTGPVIIEVKTEDELCKLVIDKPEDWKKDSKGKYHFLPAEQTFNDIGLKFQVISNSEFSKIRMANLKMLMQSRKSGSPENEAEIDNNIFKIVEDSYSISLSELRKRAELKDFTRIIQLIDKQKLFFDLDDELLSNDENTYLSMSKELSEHAKAQRLEVDNYLESSPHIECSLVPSTKDAEKALAKQKRIENDEDGRSIRRWKVTIRKGKKAGLNAFQSLLPKYYKSGNRSKRLNKKVSDFIDTFIKEKFADPIRMSNYKAYTVYKVDAKQEHPQYPPVTRKTFSKYLIRKKQREIAYARGGKRAANAASDSSEVSKRSLKAQLAFENASVDHYLSDIYIVCFSSTENIYVQRPWISAMVDEATNAILAVTILFSSPSIKSCSLLIRECVRRHGRLPQSILVDRGSDFRSVYFSSLLAHYRVDLRQRPASFPQYGSEVESLFAEFKKDWLPLKAGNITQYKEARAVDGKKSPKNTAIHDPYHFFRELQIYCNWRDDTKIIGIHNETTAKELNTHLELYPFIGNSIEYNQEFLLVSAVDCKKYKVDYQRGIHLDGRHYWHPDIQKIRGKKSKLEVRIEPENPNKIYSLIDNNWVTCESTGSQTFYTMDPVQRHINTLLARDTSKLRDFAKAEADEELVKLIKLHEKNEALNETNTFQSNYKPNSLSTNDNELSLFDQIRKKNISELESKKWIN